MATSDSEDFESADEEWGEETESVKEKLKQDFASAKPGIENKILAVDKTKSLVSEDNCTKVEEDSIAKSVERKICIQETETHASSLHISGKSAHDCEADKNLKLFKTHVKGDYNTVIENESEKSLSKKCEKDEDTKQPEINAKGDHDIVVKQVSEKPLSEVSKEEKIIKQYETHAEANYSSVAKNESEKSLSDVGNDSVEPKSKEVKPNPSPLEPNPIEVDTPVPEAGTDGWDCEDDDLNVDLIEESDSKNDMDTVCNKLSETVEKEKQNSDSGNGWGGWGGWGVTSLLSTATESVSTLTNQVSHGLSTVLETGLGVPDPEELAKQEIEEEKKLLASVQENSELNVNEKKGEEESGGLFGLGRVISGVSSITKLVETAGTKVVSGGLDTLETIGKKTMEVLQDGDPGLRKKRAIFSDKVVLSQVLREAKDKAEQEDRALQNTEEARKIHFETLFDDYHGLVHLEALEMLSKQCSIKLQSILLNTMPSDVAELQETIAEIKDLCQLPDEEDAEGASFETLEAKLSAVGKGLGVPVANEKLVKTWQEIHLWLQDCRSKQSATSEEKVGNAENSAPTAREIHQKAIGTLARLTAEAVEQFHKTAELLLVYEKRQPSEEAKILLDMTSVFSLQVSTAATVFSENLNTSSEYADNPDTINSHITNVFLEAANSSSYIQEAFQLLIPVLQVGALSS